MKKLIKKIIWRLQFNKIKLNNIDIVKGRCIGCDAGEPIVECAYFYCPCKFNEQLKRKNKQSCQK